MRNVRTLLICLAAALTGPATAATVSVDTSGLTPGVSYVFDVQLNDGSQTGDGNSVVTLSGLSLTGADALFGGASVAPDGTITLTDSGAGLPSAEFSRTFTATPGFHFDFSLAGFGGAEAAPDLFVFSLLDGSGASVLPTADPFGTALLTVGPNVTDYAPASVSVSVGGLTTPEPSGLAVVALGGGLLGLARRRLTKRHARSTILLYGPQE